MYTHLYVDKGTDIICQYQIIKSTKISWYHDFFLENKKKNDSPNWRQDKSRTCDKAMVKRTPKFKFQI
jgi:hypothetical protein